MAAKTIARITGGETLQELAAFLGAVSGMNERFRERAQAVRALLASAETGFVLVAGAHRPSGWTRRFASTRVLGRAGCSATAWW